MTVTVANTDIIPAKHRLAAFFAGVSGRFLPSPLSGNRLDDRKSTFPVSGKQFEDRESTFPVSGKRFEDRKSTFPISGKQFEDRENTFPASGKQFDVIKRIAKTDKSVSSIDEDGIGKFVEEFVL